MNDEYINEASDVPAKGRPRRINIEHEPLSAKLAQEDNGQRLFASRPGMYDSSQQLTDHSEANVYTASPQRCYTASMIDLAVGIAQNKSPFDVEDSIVNQLFEGGGLNQPQALNMNNKHSAADSSRILFHEALTSGRGSAADLQSILETEIYGWRGARQDTPATQQPECRATNDTGGIDMQYKSAGGHRLDFDALLNERSTKSPAIGANGTSADINAILVNCKPNVMRYAQPTDFRYRSQAEAQYPIGEHSSIAMGDISSLLGLCNEGEMGVEDTAFDGHGMAELRRAQQSTYAEQSMTNTVEAFLSDNLAQEGAVKYGPYMSSQSSRPANAYTPHTPQNQALGGMDNTYLRNRMAGAYATHQMPKDAQYFSKPQQQIGYTETLKHLYRSPMDHSAVGLLYGTRKKRRNNPSLWTASRLKQEYGSLMPPSKYSSLEFIQGGAGSKAFTGMGPRTQERSRNMHMLPIIIESGGVLSEDHKAVLRCYKSDVRQLDLENITVFQLKGLIKEYGLNQSGKKNELIQSIKDTLTKVESFDLGSTEPTKAEADVQPVPSVKKDMEYDKYFF